MDFLSVIKEINKVLWGWPTILLLLGTGIYFTSVTKLIQVRKFSLAFKETFGFLFNTKQTEQAKGEMSSFQSLTTAIAAQVGTGNLAGVASALASGGPGAIFWMWVSGFFGMGTIFAEAVIAKYFVRNGEDGKVGGPAYYIRYGIKNETIAKILANFFALALILALGLMGNVVQANSIAVAVNKAFAIPPIAMGIVIATLVMLIVAGGVKRIGSFTEKIVPLMALFYIIGSIVIIVMNRQLILPSLSAIFNSAFNGQAVIGGAIGATVKQAFRYGVARGLFSNEAGMGSTPHAHALANVKHPGQQGMVATLGVFIDTGIVCTITALVVMTTGALSSGLSGAELTQEAFVKGFGQYGTKFIATCLFFFAFSTIIGWYFFAETNVKYLFGKSGVIPFRFLVCTVIILGTTMNVDLVWEMADMFNALMIFPNLIALLSLSGLVMKIKNDYEDNFLMKKTSQYQIDHE